VKAIIGTNTAAKQFTLAQKSVKLAISDCSGRTTITFVALVSPSFGPTLGTQPVCTTLLDRRSITVNDPSPASAVIRDQSVVRFVGTGLSLLNAYGIGSTYVVFTRAGLTDSILVNARQDPASFAVEPASCRTGAGVRIAVGESLQISVLPPVRDANLNVFTDPAAIQAAIASVRWRVVSPLDATVSVSGVVAPRSLNSGFVKGEMLQGTTLRTVVDCYVTVY
jgi:hypothetical protein